MRYRRTRRRRVGALGPRVAALGRRAAAGVAVVLVGVFAFGCASPRDVRKEFTPYVLSPGGSHQVFVATEDTPWKHEVIALLSAELGSDCRLHVDNLRTLHDLDAGEWDVVVVLSTYYAFGLQADTAEFLDRLGQSDRVILLVTSSITDLGDFGVDAVSAASTGSVGEDARALTPWKDPAVAAAELAQYVAVRLD